MNVNLRSLQIFCDVVQRRSFSRAADDHGISQSSASQAVHQLEEQLGVLLLDRSRRPFVLTPEGERYFDGCRQLVKQHQQLEEEIRTLHDQAARRLSVASIYSVGLSHMSAFMRRFTASYPSAQVQLDYSRPDQVVALVEQGEVDLGLVSYPEESRTLAAIAWRTEPLVLVCPPGHVLAGRDSVALDDLDGQSFVAFEADLRIRSEIDRKLFVEKVNVSVAHEFDNIEMIKRDIEGGAGVSILPEPTVEKEVASGALAKVTIVGTLMERPLGIIHRRDRRLSQIAQQFVDLLCAENDFVKCESPPQNSYVSSNQSEGIIR